MSTSSPLPEIDPIHFERVWAADLSVLENLERNGDQPWVPRLIDVGFRGEPEALDALSVFAQDLGFSDLRDEDSAESGILLIGREQTADVLSIKELTRLSLQLEALFGVELDGWGCVAQTGTKQ